MIAHFRLGKNFHDDWEKEENNPSIEVEGSKEKNCLLEEWKNLEGDDDQDTGERSGNSLVGQGCCI